MTLLNAEIQWFCAYNANNPAAPKTGVARRV